MLWCRPQECESLGCIANEIAAQSGGAVVVGDPFAGLGVVNRNNCVFQNFGLLQAGYELCEFKGKASVGPVFYCITGAG